MWDGNRLLQERRGSVNSGANSSATTHVTTTVYEPESFVPLAQLAWTENAQPQAQSALAPAYAQRTGTHDEIIGGLDQALAGVDGYNTNEINRTDYQNSSDKQPPTLTTAYLTSANSDAVKLQSATINYYHCDQIGTPRELTDELGAVTWSATYKAWGRVEKEQSYTGLSLAASDGQTTSEYANSTREQPKQTHQPLRFQGQYYDAETGLHYNRSRYYDNDLGRCLTPDPLGLMAGTHGFRYAPNPVGYVDPLGLDYRSTFWRTVGTLYKDKYQVHHIIPQKVFADNIDLFNCLKMDQDSMTNLIGLPVAADDGGLRTGRSFGTSQHNTRHDAYSNSVDRAVKAIGNSNMSCSKKKLAMRGLQETLRGALQSGAPIVKGQGSTGGIWDAISGG